MAEVKVITVTAGKELLEAITKLLGSEAAAEINKAVGNVVEAAGEDAAAFDETPVGDECPECGCPDCVEEEGVEEDRVFGEILSDNDEGDAFVRTYDVVGAGDLSVTVTPQGVKVAGVRFEEDEENDTSFDNLFAPVGAFDEVEAFYDEEEATLTVTLLKVAPEGTGIEIDGWDF